MASRFDSRQTQHIAQLNQLANTGNTELDNLLESVNKEVTPPFQMRPNTGSNRVLNVGTNVVVNSETGRTKITTPISSVLTEVAAFTITFPSSPTGTITSSGPTIVGSNVLPGWASTHYIKVGVALDEAGQLSFTYGTAAASIASATPPELTSDANNIGYVVLQNNAGTVSNITNASIFQYAASGAGSGSGSGSGTFKNYLDKWFSGEKDISNVSNGGVSASGNRTASSLVWASTNTSNITVARTSTSPLRSKYSILIDVITGVINGSTFIESPTFVYDNADFRANALPLYVSFTADLSGSGILDAALVRYNSSLVFQEVIPIVGVSDNSGATPASQLISNTTKYHGYATPAGGALATDIYALRIRTNAVATVTAKIEDLYVGPNSDTNIQAQRFVGVKQYADEVELREGMNVPLNLDFTGTLSVPANETKIVGKLDILTATTVDVASGGNLVTVGAITGPGSLTGSGTVTSI